MKKILAFILFLMLSALPCFAAKWAEIFEKQYIDFETVNPNEEYKTIQFWVKALRKDPKEVFPLTNKPYWYSVSKWNIDCEHRLSRIENINVYDLQKKLVYSDDYIPDWNEIVPDTYADGYYRLFCLIPFADNPILKL